MKKKNIKFLFFLQDAASVLQQYRNSPRASVVVL